MRDGDTQFIWIDAYAVCLHRLAARWSVLLLAAPASRDVFDLIPCYPVTEIALRAKHPDDLLVGDSDVA